MIQPSRSFSQTYQQKENETDEEESCQGNHVHGRQQPSAQRLSDSTSMSCNNDALRVVEIGISTLLSRYRAVLEWRAMHNKVSTRILRPEGDTARNEPDDRMIETS